MKKDINYVDGPMLDWAVALACGLRPIINTDGPASAPIYITIPNEFGGVTTWSPSRIREQGGQIQEDQEIWLQISRPGGWLAHKVAPGYPLAHITGGPTVLIASMRCVVVSKLGDHIDYPEIFA